MIGRAITATMAVITIFLFSTVDRVHAQRITGGYVLTHEHPMNALAFGGNYAFTGARGNFRNGIMLEGYTAPAPGCRVGQRCSYGQSRGLLADEALGGDMGLNSRHWGPKRNAFAHARYSTEWIKEAFSPTEEEFQDTRMKIMVAFAVESFSMCETLYWANLGGGGPGGDGFPCVRGDSRLSNKRQIDAIKAWAAENSDWVEIALTARDARRIANQNKLVVILGIESDYDFGAEDRTFDPIERLEEYYSWGVRTFYLAHKLNSRLSGADVYLPRPSTGGKAIRANQAIAGCLFYDDNVGNFPLKNNLGQSFCDNTCGPDHFKGHKGLGWLDKCNYLPSDFSEVNTIDYIMGRGAGTFNGFKIYPRTPGFPTRGGTRDDTRTHPGVIIERNYMGLSYDGERVVRAAMQKGMIVNIDHISSQGRIDVRRVSRDFRDYPLNALHNNPNGIMEPYVSVAGGLPTRWLHEYDFDDNELELVRETGGFFGVRVGPINAKVHRSSRVREDCPKTITETAQVLSYLLDKGLNLGYSLDYATITKGVFSRTDEKCKLRGRTRTDFLDTYWDEKSGQNFQADGLSHIGVMKKWHRELEEIGYNPNHLRRLRNDGPEAFIRMWEASEAKSSSGNQIPRRTFPRNPPPDWGCQADSECASNQFCSKGLIAGIGRNKCADKRDRRKVCTQARHCLSGRCAAGLCAVAHRCNGNSDCRSGQYCATPVGGARSCKALKRRGQACTAAKQCSSNRCAWGTCRDANECRLNRDCRRGQYCGNPIAGKRSCKAKLSQGKLCTGGTQCSSGCCKPHIRSGGLPSCRPSNKCR